MPKGQSRAVMGVMVPPPLLHQSKLKVFVSPNTPAGDRQQPRAQVSGGSCPQHYRVPSKHRCTPAPSYSKGQGVFLEHRHGYFESRRSVVVPKF